MRTTTLPFLLLLFSIVLAERAEARQVGPAGDLNGMTARLGTFARHDGVRAAGPHRPPAAVLLLSAETVNESLHRVARTHLGARGDAVAPGGLDRILTALVSTALGAGLGFFASQVVRGDWDDGPGQPQMNRAAWAGVGGAVGLVVGYSFSPARRVRPLPSPVLPFTDRSVITLREIWTVVAANAHEAVHLLRPEWLGRRQPSNIGRSAPVELVVYLDDFRLGGIETLRDLNAQTISSIRFISAGKATVRWGPGNSLGVIQVIQSPTLTPNQ